MEGIVATLASGKRVLLGFVGQLYIDFCLFLWPPWLNLAHSCMVWDLFLLYKLNDKVYFKTIKTDNVTSGTKEHESAQAV